LNLRSSAAVFATLGIGFSWGGFMLGSTAKTMADSAASSAVVAAIAPICVDQFQRNADATDNLMALKKTDSWQQAAYGISPVVQPGVRRAREPRRSFSSLRCPRRRH
jgi:hypothetical protein